MIVKIKDMPLNETRKELGKYAEQWQKLPPGPAFKQQRDALARAIWERANRTKDRSLLGRPWAIKIRAYVTGK